MYDAKTAAHDDARRRRRIQRQVIIGVVLVLVITLAVARDRGYGVLIGGGPTGETRGTLSLLNCTYFTGTERVIHREWKAESVGSCPLVNRVGKLPAYADPKYRS